MTQPLRTQRDDTAGYLRDGIEALFRVRFEIKRIHSSGHGIGHAFDIPVLHRKSAHHTLSFTGGGSRVVVTMLFQ